MEGRGGGGYLSNVRYRPDPTTYPLVRAHAFAPSAITQGWSISDAYPLASTDPDAYPDVGSLRWQPVEAEREGMVDIGRYRKDPRVAPPRPSAGGPVSPSPGMQVVFARTQITSDRARTAKVWVGYSDDIVVFLNGQPLYAGRNGLSYRAEGSLGWFYPYADAVFLPLRRGPNELVLAVSESFGGWAFMCRFDHP